jgi:DNA segregation ATPase FtsK/SpoIIIE, S-DNA-T family
VKSIQLRTYVLSIVYAFAAVFATLALVSYNPQDPSFNSIGKRQFAENYCGLFGSFFSDILLQLFGVTVWGLVGLLVFMAFGALRNKRETVEWDKAAIGGLLLINASCLLSLHLPHRLIYENNVYVSGVIGKFLQEQLKRLFNGVGVGLIFWATFSVLIVLMFGQLAIEKNFNPIEILSRMFAALKTSKILRAGPILKKKEGVSARMTTPAPKPAAAMTIFADDEVEEEEDGEEEEEESAPSPSIFGGALPLKRRRVDLKKKVQRKIANWKLPELAMLEDPPETRYRVDEKEIKSKSAVLVDKLSQFSVKGEVKGAKPGPAVTLFEFKPNADVKISKITELADDLSLALSSESVRIIAPIPGRDVVGIETSNSHRETVYLKDVLALDDFWSDDVKLPLALGRQADGEPKVVDLRKMPHLLVAGTTGSGKSVFVVCALTGLLFRHSPQTLRLILIDPKQVDLAAFSEVPHLLLPMVTDPKKAVNALNWAVREMEKRYRSMSKFGARGIEAYNEKVAQLTKDQIEEHELANLNLEQGVTSYYFTPVPLIVIVVEEFGDLMAVDKNNVEHAVVRLAQMARACGIHLILAMQSPRKDVVTGLIKTNIPGRISFKVASKMDSRIILDDSGAERLLARGDMLFLAPGVAKPERHHGPWVTEDEINAVMKYWSGQGAPEYDESAMRAIAREAVYGQGGADVGAESDHDERYDEILAWVSGLKSVSASLVQRKFRLGYPRAARMIELFEKEGVVGPANGSKPREVLVRSYDDKSI